MATTKPVNTIVLDTGAIIKNHPSVSTLLAQSENLVTVPAIIAEIKDAVTRSRVQTTLMPFLTLRTPNPASIKVVSEFARRTGDLAVLSRPDIQIIALAYELECERNGGDWRLRRVPGQKGLNGTPPPKDEQPKDEGEKPTDEADKPKDDDANNTEGGVSVVDAQDSTETTAESTPSTAVSEPSQAEEQAQESAAAPVSETAATADASVDQIDEALATTKLDAAPEGEQAQDSPIESTPAEAPQAAEGEGEDEDDDANSSDSDSGGWITPSNLKKQQEKDAGVTVNAKGNQTMTMQVGTLTTDFAMQNVILQMNLNLLSPSMHRIKHIKNFILRCHACFKTTKVMDKQFCESCGKPTLTRVACSTDANGEFKLHLKKNMQWSKRGNVFSIPKAVHGSSNGRLQGGGKGGWGNELILAEDQKEYLKAQTIQKRQTERDLMDEDYLPGILTGDRGRAGGRIQVGGGRNVNSRKR